MSLAGWHRALQALGRVSLGLSWRMSIMRSCPAGRQAFGTKGWRKRPTSGSMGTFRGAPPQLLLYSKWENTIESTSRSTCAAYHVRGGMDNTSVSPFSPGNAVYCLLDLAATSLLIQANCLFNQHCAKVTFDELPFTTFCWMLLVTNVYG